MYKRKPNAIDSVNHVTAMCRNSIVRGDVNQRFHLPPPFIPVGPVVQKAVYAHPFYAQIADPDFEGEDIFGNPLEPKGKKKKKEKTDLDLEPRVYYMKKKLGRLPVKGEYIIQVSSDPHDVWIVKTRSEQKNWGTSIVDGGLRLFDKYKVILDPDGIHAEVVLDPTSLLVARCANCMKLIELEDLKKSHTDYFCCFKCKKEYQEKARVQKEQLKAYIREENVKTAQRLKAMQDDLQIKFANNEIAFAI